MPSVHSQNISAKWINKNLNDAARQYKVMMQKVPAGVMPDSYLADTLKTCTSKERCKAL